MKNDTKAYTVSQLNHYIAAMFSSEYALNNITIQGEISNLKYHPTGHIYFTLKDAASQISGIMFAGDRAGLPFTLENGMRVLCTGHVGVYERGGSYQLYAKRFRIDGIGELYIRFEQLKQELSEMGMFDPMYKKPIPRYAQRIGVVTARTGAAIRDIVQIAKRRNPYVDITLFPALVQGDGAAASIVQGIRTLDALGLDVLIVGRGGGSIEDLWAFNEASVAQAIFEADTPVISAVGHETDTTIADFVSDQRAPTPSAAAELAVFDFRQLTADIAGCRAALDADMREHLQTERQRVSMYQLRLSPYRPEVRLKEYQHRIFRKARELQTQMETMLSSSEARLSKYRCLQEMMSGRIQEARERLHAYAGEAEMRQKETLQRSRQALALRTERLEAQSPLRRLREGYGYLQDEDGHRIRSVQGLRVGDRITARLTDGYFESRIEYVGYHFGKDEHANEKACGCSRGSGN